MRMRGKLQLSVVGGERTERAKDEYLLTSAPQQTLITGGVERPIIQSISHKQSPNLAAAAAAGKTQR